MSAALVLGGILAVLCVLWVARPYLREPAVVASDDRLEGHDGRGRERELRAERRDRALEALAELEFDHRTGKVADGDYRELVAPLRAEAAAALKALDETPPA